MSLIRLFTPRLTCPVAALGQAKFGRTWPLSQRFERGKHLILRIRLYAIIQPTYPFF
jgi:hypothetical protein